MNARQTNAKLGVAILVLLIGCSRGGEPVANKSVKVFPDVEVAELLDSNDFQLRTIGPVDVLVDEQSIDIPDSQAVYYGAGCLVILTRNTSVEIQEADGGHEAVRKTARLIARRLLDERELSQFDKWLDRRDPDAFVNLEFERIGDFSFNSMGHHPRQPREEYEEYWAVTINFF